MPAPIAVPGLPRIDIVIISYGALRFRPRCALDASALEGVGYVCISPPPCSHNHYDHLDSGTIRDIAKAWPEAVWFVPMGNRDLVASFGVAHLHELDWWENVTLPGVRGGEGAPGTDVTVVCTPCQHFSGPSAPDHGL